MRLKQNLYLILLTALCLPFSFPGYSQEIGVNKASLSVVDVRTDRSLLRDPGSQSFLAHFFLDFFEKKDTALTRIRCRSEGAGVILDPSGLVLTNEHVIADADNIQVVLADRRVFRAVVLGRDRKEDLALLRIDGSLMLKLTPLVLADSDALQPGEKVFAVGNPYGYSRSVSSGVISALHRQFSARDGVPFGDLIQTDASANPGNSGGPLLNQKGEMIGLITLRDWRAYGINFAIPVNRIKALLPELKTSKIAQDSLEQFQKRFGFQIALEKNRNGFEQLFIQNVRPRSSAQKAGLRRGDALQLFQKRAVRDPEALVQTAQKVAPGERVYVQIQRNEQSFFTYLGAQ